VLVQGVYVHRLYIVYGRSRLLALALSSLLLAGLAFVIATIVYLASYIGRPLDPSSYDYRIRCAARRRFGADQRSFAPASFLPTALDIAISALYLLRLRRLRLQQDALVDLPGNSDDRLTQRIFARLTIIALQYVISLCIWSDAPEPTR